jgi:glycosyltransferase involved in cell wall biosynthesis
VHLVCSPDSSFEHIAELTVHSIPMQRNPSPLKDIVSLYRWQRLVKSLQPDIIVGSTPKAGLLSMLAAKWSNVPVRIYHVLGFRAEGLTGITKRISLFAERLTISEATEVLCASPSLKAALIDSGCLDKRKGVVLGAGSCCGADTEFFRPPTLDERQKARTHIGLKDTDLTIGFVGRLTKDKGVRELVRAVLKVNKTHSNVQLVLFGPDEGGIDYLGDLLQEDAVTCMGPTSDVRSAYWAFDVFALPSYREGFPISSLEAQSCGLPLITTNATGCIDSQPPDNSRLTVPVKDSDSLATAIEYLITNPGKPTNMGLQARQWVLKNFNSTDVVLRHTRFLERQAAQSLKYSWR